MTFAKIALGSSIILICLILLSGCSALNNAGVVGTYRDSEYDPLYLVYDTLTIKNDGTYSSSYSGYVYNTLTGPTDGTWTVEGNILKLTPNEVKTIAAGKAGCESSTFLGCQKSVPGNKVITLTIEMNKLVDEKYHLTWRKCTIDTSRGNICH